MKNIAAEGTGKNAIFKKWWFWILLVVILSAILGAVKAADKISGTVNSANSQAASDEFVDAVISAASTAIAGSSEAVTGVVLDGRDLCVTVDLSKTDPSPFTVEDLAISRTVSITDAILDLADYDSEWDTITIDFGDIGKVVCGKDSIQENEFGGRYFPSAGFILQ